MAEDTASLVQFYAREGAGGAISVDKRVAASWHAACPGQEVLHGVQYVGTVADPTAFGAAGSETAVLALAPFKELRTRNQFRI